MSMQVFLYKKPRCAYFIYNNNDLVMRVVTKTPKKVVLEVEVEKIETYGFDFVWDEVRDKFPKSKFKDFNIIDESGGGIVVFELINTSSRSKKRSTYKKNDLKKINVSILESGIKKG